MEDFKQADGSIMHQNFKTAGLAVETKLSAADGVTRITLPMLSKQAWSLFQTYMNEANAILTAGGTPTSTFKAYATSGTTIVLGASSPVSVYEPESTASGLVVDVCPDLKQKVANDGSVSQVKLDFVTFMEKLTQTAGQAKIIIAMDAINTSFPNAEVFFDPTTIVITGSDTSAVALFVTEDTSADLTDSFELNQGQSYCISGVPSYASVASVSTYKFKVTKIANQE